MGVSTYELGGGRLDWIECPTDAQAPAGVALLPVMP